MTNKEQVKSRRALERAIADAGSVAALAESLDVTRQAVYNWRSGATIIAVKNALKVSRITSVELADLRPDMA